LGKHFRADFVFFLSRAMLSFSPHATTSRSAHPLQQVLHRDGGWWLWW